MGELELHLEKKIEQREMGEKLYHVTWHTNKNYVKQSAHILNDAPFLIAILPELSSEFLYLLIHYGWSFVYVRILRHK